MKSLKEYIVNESVIKLDVRVDIDSLTNSDWKKFAKLIVKQLNNKFDEDNVLMAMKALAGENYSLCPADFYIDTQEGSDYIAAVIDGENMYYDPDSYEWEKIKA